MDQATIDSEFLRPLVNGWLSKLEASAKGRKEWKDTADECSMFYSYSAQAMWDPTYSKKFWKGVKLPKFRITMNKAFEMVAIFGPNLFWEIPHRMTESKRPLDIKPEYFGLSEEMIAEAQQQMQQMQQQMQQGGMQEGGMGPPMGPPGMGPMQPQQPQMDPRIMQYEQLVQQQADSEQQDQCISYLMDRWLNYTPREQPGGGLSGHTKRAVVDSLLTGRGVLASRPYQMPGSGRNLTGAFRVDPKDVFLDPDFNSVDECSWLAIRHTDVHSDVEERFQLPKGALKNKATLESTWQFSELTTDDQSSAHRREGKTNDLVVWYEIFSKAGLGVSNTSIEPTIRDHLSETVGRHAYIAVCADVPYPLNMHAEKIRKGATDEDVAENFSWPVPFWADDRWPVEFLDYYIDPASAWPIAPMAPGLGELKLLNFLMSWFANRTWSSSRDFWAVAQPHLEHYKDYILNGEDQSIIPTPVGMKTPKEAVEILTQPESRQDMTQLISFVSDNFDKRVGLTPTVYGQNENNTQNRTAEETMAKQRAVMARPEFMQKQVVDWQSRIAQSEAFVTRWFVTAEDVAPLLGPAGSMLWEQHITSTDVELVVRQFNYTVEAASIRRPNRDRDIANYQQVMNLFSPTLSQYGQSSGDYNPFNGMMQEWARLHDANLEPLAIPPKEPTPEEQKAQELQIAEQEATVQKITAEAQSIAAEAQMKPMEMQAEQTQQQMQLQLEQLRQQGEQMKQQADMAKIQMELQGKQAGNMQELQNDQITHLQELTQDEERHEQDLEQQREMAKARLAAQKAANVVAAKRARARTTTGNGRG